MSGHPKLFVSYSWGSAEHQEWVLRLATSLRESGVDVILDKWHLREGDDAHAFMERMVNDPEIKKVAMVCDRRYVDKANGREGGVGTETQIISPEIYAQQNQQKFVALVLAEDESGRVAVPAYYRSRIHIDFRQEDAYADSFDQVLRWAYDKPLHQAPALGQPPAFLADAAPLSLATTALHRRAVEALRNHKPHTDAAVREYSERFGAEMEKLRLQRDETPFDEAVLRSIAVFTPYRNEAIELFLAMADYQADDDKTATALHRFFELLVPYLERPENVSRWIESDFDNFRFVIPELFQYAVATLAIRERFVALTKLLSTDFFLPQRADYGRETMVGYARVFRTGLQSLEHRQRATGRVSLRADLLKERCVGLRVDFQALMQADFLLFLHAHFHQSYWFPHSLVYACDDPRPFELFARSTSEKYFKNVKMLLGLDDKQPLVELVATSNARDSAIPRWNWHTLDVRRLVNLEQLATRP